MLFPGSSVQWNSLTDVTDARMLAKQLLWAAITPSARNQAFNVVNGDIFRWNWMWKRIAAWFGVEAAELQGEGAPLVKQLADAAPIWKGIAEKYGLKEADINVLAFPLAHRCRSRASSRGCHRYVQEPQGWLHRLPGN